MIELDFEKTGGLIPAVVQDFQSHEVLMLAYVNAEAWAATLKTGKATYWSRSRRQLWVKGETSGHVQVIREIRIDCDNDTVLFRVEQRGGAACHTGHRSCFHKRVEEGGISIADAPVFDPEAVYGKTNE
jgi:phosphoribosyl-AMP cyclohydrolase